MPGSFDDGMLFRTRMRQPTAFAAVHASVRIVDIEIVLAARAARTDLVEEGGELEIRYRRAVNIEGRKIDPVRGSFVVRTVIAPHDEAAGRNGNHRRQPGKLRERGSGL